MITLLNKFGPVTLCLLVLITAVAVGKSARSGPFKIDPTVDMKTPPKEQVEAMSVGAYFAYAAEVPNSINRFAVSSWMPFKYNPDGSLDLYIQNENPGADKEPNWLPAPKALFNLTMRIYAPKQEVLVGKWNPPPVTMIQALPALATQ